jgi:tRNA (guanine37-N1)-methyltransferase
MKITIITLFSKTVEAFFGESILKRAQEKGLVQIEIVDLRQFTIDKRGTVDDHPYGGGPGMVLRVEPVYEAIKYVKNSKHQIPKSKIILTSPRGKVFNQELAKKYAKLDHLVIVCGHYEGVDERVSHFVDEEVSIGDFVLTGGEIAAAAIVDSVVRLIPGVLNKEESPKEESFSLVDIDELITVVGEDEILQKLKKAGRKRIKLLEYPQYTRPKEFKNLKVPAVLLSGDHRKIRQWRLKKAYEITKRKRSNLFLIY